MNKQSTLHLPPWAHHMLHWDFPPYTHRLPAPWQSSHGNCTHIVCVFTNKSLLNVAPTGELGKRLSSTCLVRPAWGERVPLTASHTWANIKHLPPENSPREVAQPSARHNKAAVLAAVLSCLTWPGICPGGHASLHPHQQKLQHVPTGATSIYCT